MFPFQDVQIIIDAVEGKGSWLAALKALNELLGWALAQLPAGTATTLLASHHTVHLSLSRQDLVAHLKAMVAAPQSIDPAQLVSLLLAILKLFGI